MSRRADQVHWIESTAAGGSARRAGTLRVSRLLAAADGTARRHPAAVAAALFCGGLATGTWLGLAARNRAQREEEDAAGLAENRGPAQELRDEVRAAVASDVVAAPAGGASARVAKLRNPIGSPSVLQP